MKHLTLLFLLLLTVPVAAQTDCACCTEAHARFDFWVGDWNVYDSLENKVGENTIMKLEENCILLEQWRGTGGGSGTSMNFYDPSDSTWNQLWVDSNGGNLRLKGGFADGKMEMKSDLIEGRPIGPFYHRITWTALEDGTVTQTWELIDQKGKVLRIMFSGIYMKKQ